MLDISTFVNIKLKSTLLIGKCCSDLFQTQRFLVGFDSFLERTLLSVLRKSYQFTSSSQSQMWGHLNLLIRVDLSAPRASSKTRGQAWNHIPMPISSSSGLLQKAKNKKIKKHFLCNYGVWSPCLYVSLPCFFSSYIWFPSFIFDFKGPW